MEYKVWRIIIILMQAALAHMLMLWICFLKYSTRGDFSQFSKIIEGFNGRIVSLENPHYIKANLKLEKDYIEDLKQDKELGISHEQFQVLADCFIRGADM